MTRVSIVLLFCTSACLFPIARRHRPDLHKSVNYDRFRGQIAYSATLFHYTDTEQRAEPLQLLRTADLTRPVIAKAFLPEPFGRDRFARCVQSGIQHHHGTYQVAHFVTVAIDGVESTVDLEELIEPYADQTVEVDAEIFSPATLGFPFDAYDYHAAFVFDQRILPRLRPGSNRLAITAGIRCATDPSIAVSLAGQLDVIVDATTLAEVRDTVGPVLQIPRLTNLTDEVPTLTTTIAAENEDYQPLLVQPVDRDWKVKKDGVLPVSRDFEGFVIAKHKPSEQCFGARFTVRSEFILDGNGYSAPRLVLGDWLPFPCENLERRVPVR